MIIRVGDIEFQLTLINNPNANPLDHSLRELLRGASITVFAPSLGMTKALPVPEIEESEDTEDDEEDALSNHRYEPRHKKQTEVNESDELSTVKSGAQLTEHTITMIGRKVLGCDSTPQGVPINRKNIPRVFDYLKSQSLHWLNRKLREDIWAIFISTIQVPAMGRRIVAVGLTKDNHQTILGMTEKNEITLFEDLIKRGLNVKNIQFGMLGFQLNQKAFHKFFPNTELARDWSEFIGLSEDVREREDLKELMVNPSKKEAQQALKTFKAPPELLTYFKFPRDMWRVLRTANNINKIELELRASTKGKTKYPDLLVIWTLLRIQYQFQRIPVNAKQFESFRNVAPIIEVSK